MTSATDVARQGPGMSAAAAELTPSRRTFLAQAASSAAFVVAVSPALSEPGDPIFAAIASHRSANAMVRRQVDIHARLEAELPKNRRRSSVRLGDESIVTTDDPRWIESERAIYAAFDAETDAALTLVNILPTTAAGVIALLQYAVSADPDGMAWPDLMADETDKLSKPWHYFLIANLAAVLPGMVSA